eukprot:1535296-Heterocapsa_arctica.AAC.1
MIIGKPERVATSSSRAAGGAGGPGGREQAKATITRRLPLPPEPLAPPLHPFPAWPTGARSGPPP